MKSYTLPVLALLFAVSYAGAEVIDSVMYNPARLGQYEKLKVSDKASFKGGVQAGTLTLQSAGTVTVNNAGDYQVQNADIEGTVRMPNTHFVAPTIKAQGGTAQFVQTGETSSIDTINSVLPRLKANILKLNTVTVNGTSTTDYEEDTLKGLKLGGNDIPAPSVNCSGLSWFPRAAEDGKTYQVLGLAACKQGLIPDEMGCTNPLEYNPQTKQCECPTMPLCLGKSTKNPITCQCECKELQVCPAGEVFDKKWCGCRLDEQKLVNCLGYGKETLFTYNMGAMTPCSYLVSDSQMIGVTTCSVRIASIQECIVGLNVWPEMLPSGCTPGKPCPSCVVGKTYVGYEGLPSGMVYCGQDGGSVPSKPDGQRATVYKVKTYACYQGDESCRDVTARPEL